MGIGNVKTVAVGETATTAMAAERQQSDSGYIHAWILSYLSKENFLTVLPYLCKNISLIGQHFFNSSRKFLFFDTHYDTISKQIIKITSHFLLVFKKKCIIFPCFRL